MSVEETAVERAINDFADRVGEDRSKIGWIDPQFDRLLMKGAVIRLTTGGYEGTTQIVADDLGWNTADMSTAERQTVSRLFRELGKRPLVKPSIIQEGKSIRNAARADIDRLTFRLFDGETRFVPENVYPELVDKLEAHQKRYFELRDDLAANLDEYREAVRPDYDIWARRLWTQLHAYKADSDPTKPELEEFVRTTVERLMILNKSPEKIVSQFKFQWRVAVLPLAQDIARDMTAARDIRVEAAVEREMVAEQSRLQRDLLQQSARTRDEEMREFWSEVKGSLREKLYLAMVDALAALENKTNLPSANVSALRRLLDLVNKMKFWPDSELDEQMNRVKLIIGASEASSTPDTFLMSKVMQTVGSELRLQMLDLEYRPQRESRAGRKSGPEVGIPETREGLEYVIERFNGRQARPVIEMDDGDIEFDLDELDEEIVVQRQARDSREVQEVN